MIVTTSRHAILRHVPWVCLTAMIVALRRGQYRTILTDDDRELFAFERWTGDQKITVVVNNADRAGTVSLAGMGSWKQLFVAGSAKRTGAGSYRLGARSLAVFEVPR